MSSNPETRFGKRFRKLVPPEAHLIRVENPACPGTPDINVCYNGIEFWIELKHTHELPKRPDTPVFRGALKPEQVLWHYQRSRAKGRSYIVAEVEDEGITYVIEGKHSREFNSLSKSQLDDLNLKPEEMWK